MQGLENDYLYEFDVVIVGAGFFGLTLAYEISTRSKLRVIVLDKRSHLGGNAYSYTDPTTNIEIHKYGSHLFHTSNKRVWDFVNQFDQFNSYIHTVKTIYRNQVFPMPINLQTISQFVGKYLDPKEAREWIEIERGSITHTPRNLEEQAIKLIGKTLYNALIKGYTLKQWATNPVDLPSEIISRIPIRYNFNDRYFSDKYEGLPVSGYGHLFENMRLSGNFEVYLNYDFNPAEHQISKFNKLIYTGPIDRFFAYRHGVLGWRTLDFEEETLPINDFQGTSVMNFAEHNIPYTRIHEFKHLHPERTQSETSTVIFKEFSRFAGKDDEPYYPINSELDRDMLLLYRSDAAQLANVVFGGRLGRYQYLDMHMAIASALSIADDLIAKNNFNSESNT
jgi:UDP-galactopyranose mutase